MAHAGKVGGVVLHVWRSRWQPTKGVSDDKPLKAKLQTASGTAISTAGVSDRPRPVVG